MLVKIIKENKKKSLQFHYSINHHQKTILYEILNYCTIKKTKKNHKNNINDIMYKMCIDSIITGVVYTKLFSSR